MHTFQLGIWDRIVDDHNGARLRPERRDGVQGDPVVDTIGRWRHNDVAAGADSLLESAIILNQRISRAQHCLRVDGIFRIIDVMMTIAGIGRGLELGGVGTL